MFCIDGVQCLLPTYCGTALRPFAAVMQYSLHSHTRRTMSVCSWLQPEGSVKPAATHCLYTQATSNSTPALTCIELAVQGSMCLWCCSCQIIWPICGVWGLDPPLDLLGGALHGCHCCLSGVRVHLQALSGASKFPLPRISP